MLPSQSTIESVLRDLRCYRAPCEHNKLAYLSVKILVDGTNATESFKKHMWRVLVNPPGLKPTPNLLNQMENLSNCPIILQLISNFHKFSQVSYLSS